jgi:hypothetical protein
MLGHLSLNHRHARNARLGFPVPGPRSQGAQFSQLLFHAHHSVLPGRVEQPGKQE